jgi:plasmid maintenance system antidote protein VapI
LSEHDITRLVTNRKDPTPAQATALARVLGRSTVELFPHEVNP